MSAELTRLKNLLAVGETLLAPPLTFTLGFDHDDCGTYACFVGHYERRHGLIATTDWAYKLDDVAAHFGLTEREADHLFEPREDGSDVPGQEAYDELKLRLGVLREIIAAKEAAERPKLRAIA